MSSESEPARRRRLHAPDWRTILKRPGIVQALVLLVLLLALPEIFPTAFEEFALKTFDVEQRIAPRHEVDLPVVIVAVDEASLGPPQGQWPWPRTLVARLVRKIAEGKPAALGVDIIFPEPDRLAPQNLSAALPDLPPDARAALAALPDSESVLGAAFKSLPTVLGMAPSYEESSRPKSRIVTAPVLGVGGDPLPFIQSFPGAVRSLPPITAGETSAAALVGNPDSDGIVRRVPLVVEVGGNLFPGLATETLRLAIGGRALGVVTTTRGIAGVRVGDTLVPTDRQGRAYPYFAPPQSSTIISASDVLDGKFDVSALNGQIVLLGVTGIGLVDIKQTPVGLMQGIEVHAQLIESILTGSVLRRPLDIRMMERAIVVVTALVIIFLLPYRRTPLAAAMLLTLIVVGLSGMFLVFRLNHLLIDGTYPSVAAILTFTVMTTASLRRTEGERRQLARDLELEREAKARMEGELNAARAIQMGLLPRPLPRLPENRSVEVHALLETARLVGGDLYDFVMLDSRHLFFAIADVSGKGVDAALFMAMTKMVLGSALQHGLQLDRVLTESNGKISEASDHIRAEGGRPMFVTIFAIILDVDTGAVIYASGGHDSAYRLRAGAPPARLDTDGGPPLGTLDDFPFPVDEAQLEPGDILLLYTDGVTEAKDEAGDFYTSARLDRLVTGNEPISARISVETVREDVRRFVGAADQADDITLLAVRWLGPRSDIPT